jgi:hypothetical protein
VAVSSRNTFTRRRAARNRAVVFHGLDLLAGAEAAPTLSQADQQRDSSRQMLFALELLGQEPQSLPANWRSGWLRAVAIEVRELR